MVDNYLKSSLKIFTDYCISLILFGVFLSVPLSLAGEKFFKWIPLYSVLIFLLMFSIVYFDSKKLAQKDKRNHKSIKSFPLKGLLLGVIGFAPVMILVLVYPFILSDIEAISRLKHVILNTVLGPLYFFIKLGNESAAVYIVSLFIVPAVTMIGYLSGYFNFEAGRYFKMLRKVKK